MTIDRILHLPRVVAIFCKSCLIVPIYGPHELGVLLWVAVVRRGVVATVPYAIVNPTNHKEVV